MNSSSAVVTLLCGLLACISCKSESSPVAPNSPPAARRFIATTGEVRLDGTPAREGVGIGSQARIDVGPGGQAVITLGQGSVIELRANSQLVLGSSQRKKDSLRLLTGTLWSFLPQSSSYEVVTANAVAGVRGTVFFVEATSPTETYVCACSGEVHVQGTPHPGIDRLLTSPADNHHGLLVSNTTDETTAADAPRRGHTDQQSAQLMKYLSNTTP